MIYEPENLKNKRAIYEKRDKWLIRLAFLFWAVLLFIYVNIVIPYVKSTIGFLTIYEIIEERIVQYATQRNVKNIDYAECENEEASASQLIL